MTIYLRKSGSRVWHWCRNCSRLHTDPPYEVRYARPETGELCLECQTRAAAGACALTIQELEDDDNRLDEALA